jgi:multicomponent K+:H+ antiporter subunit D
MNGWVNHLPIFPIVVPLVAGAVMLLFAEARRAPRTIIALVATLANLLVALALAYIASDAVPSIWPDGIAVYLLGGWQAPFGIVLVLDRLSALMLVLNAVLALTSLIYALARWRKAGPHFQSLFQFLIMGVNGAFLTGDLFNLFVFVEVLLAASYGLLLHGMGEPRVKAGLHYIAINLAGSSVFLIGVSLIYGVTGTLNMADVAARASLLTEDERILFETGIAILGSAFLLKAGAWPLNFWLPSAYGTAAPPVAAVFSIMTKVGIYALLRLGSLLAGASGASVPAPFNDGWLFGIGIVTLMVGTAGILTASQPQRLVACCVIASAGTLLAALGFGGTAMKGAALYYLTSSVLATGAFFMLCEMIDRTRQTGEDMPLEMMESIGQEPVDADFTDEVVGIVIPAAMAFLGMGFLACALLVAGLPPLSGFIAKFLILSATLTDTAPGPVPVTVWVLWASVLGSSLIAIIALCRMGILLFWGSDEIMVPRLRLGEAVPVAVLLLLSVALAIETGPAMDYLNLAGNSLSSPQVYIDAVLSGSRPPGPSFAPSIPVEGIRQ